MLSHEKGTSMRTLPTLCLLAAFALPGAAQEPPKRPAPPVPPTAVRPPRPAVAPVAPLGPGEEDQALYAVGLSIWQSLKVFDLTPAEFEHVKRGLVEAAAGKSAPDLTPEAYGPKIQALVQGRVQRRLEKETARSAEYLAKAEQEPGAVKSASGLVYREVAAGTGETPQPTDTVKVHYRGTLVDGTEFDSSFKRDAPAQFQVGGVIKCWSEGLQKMKVGGKAKLVCPASIAYGDRGRPSIPGGATLLFDVELIEIVPRPAAAAAPTAPAVPAPAPIPTSGAKAPEKPE
jgi:FKBP-type peptidyl-prolyl cis-trans isomerase FkpA